MTLNAATYDVDADNGGNNGVETVTFYEDVINYSYLIWVNHFGGSDIQNSQVKIYYLL